MGPVEARPCSGGRMGKGTMAALLGMLLPHWMELPWQLRDSGCGQMGEWAAESASWLPPSAMLTWASWHLQYLLFCSPQLSYCFSAASPDRHKKSIPSFT